MGFNSPMNICNQLLTHIDRWKRQRRTITTGRIRAEKARLDTVKVSSLNVAESVHGAETTWLVLNGGDITQHTMGGDTIKSF